MCRCTLTVPAPVVGGAWSKWNADPAVWACAAPPYKGWAVHQPLYPVSSRQFAKSRMDERCHIRDRAEQIAPQLLDALCSPDQPCVNAPK